MLSGDGNHGTQFGIYTSASELYVYKLRDYDKVERYADPSVERPLTKAYSFDRY
jgi:hypothetical protein